METDHHLQILLLSNQCDGRENEHQGELQGRQLCEVQLNLLLNKCPIDALQLGQDILPMDLQVLLVQLALGDLVLTLPTLLDDEVNDTSEDGGTLICGSLSICKRVLIEDPNAAAATSYFFILSKYQSNILKGRDGEIDVDHQGSKMFICRDSFRDKVQQGLVDCETEANDSKDR